MTEQILKAVSRFRRHNGKDNLPVHPGFCVLLLILVILLTAFSKNMFFVYCVLAIELLILCTMKTAALKRTVHTVLAAAALSILITLPAILLKQTTLTITIKVIVTVTAVCILNETLSFSSLMQGLSFFHLPEMFLLTLDLTVRFIDELASTARSMEEALTLRSVGKDSWKTAQTGEILGTLFLTAMKRSEETHEAMVCRCFDGTYRISRKHTWNKTDLIPLILTIIILLLFFILEVQ